MSVLNAGFAQIDITPEKPGEVFLDGYGDRLSPAEGVRDPLYAKVCFLSSGERRFAIISVDLCGFGCAVKDRLCALISQITGMPREHFALCATHTHAAPACGVLSGLPISMIYFDTVGQRIADAVIKARESAVPGAFQTSFGDSFNAGYNRRKKENIDRRVFVWSFRDGSGALRGALASASCHAVCSTDMLISADYPGVLTGMARERLGDGVPVLFLQGRGADIDPTEFHESGILKAGEALGKCVFSGIERAADGGVVDGELSIAFAEKEIPFASPDPEALSVMTAKYTKRLAETDDPFKRRCACVELVWAYNAKKNVGRTPTVGVDLQMLKLGDGAAVAFVPFELLTLTGDALESILLSHGVKAPDCLVVGYANGTNGYLCPSAEASLRDYETAGASHWYGLPECSELTERAVLDGMSGLADRLFGS